MEHYVRFPNNPPQAFSMKIPLNPFIGSVSAIATLLTFVDQSRAQVLFQDNFTVSAQSLDINFELNGGRQVAGTLGPKTLVESVQPDDYRTQVNEGTFPQSLFLLPTTNFNASSELLVSPNFNFNTSGARLLLGVVALNQPSIAGADYIGFDVGANTALDQSYAGSGVGILLRPQFTGVAGQANYVISSGGTVLASGNSAAIGATRNALTISINAAAFDGTAAAVDFGVNGISLFAGTIAGGFTNNFVTLGAANFGGAVSAERTYGFDDLQVTVVPEPSTYVLALVGAVAVFGFGKKSRSLRVTKTS